ncbi:MAG: molybdopterin converting factor subunit 1 [Burkholderiales bacterium]|nr:molybdopterin converting factor subunit 1 [Burkholderiales bacterium]
MVKLLYFAGLREALGIPGESLALPAPDCDVAALRAHLAARGGAWAEQFAAARNLRAAVNQDMAAAAAPVRDGDEVAFFPPVTGG